MDLQDEYENAFNRSDEEMAEIYEAIRIVLRGKTKAEIMDALREQDSETLRWICRQVALPTEDYEICGAAQAVLESRKELL